MSKDEKTTTNGTKVTVLDAIEIKKTIARKFKSYWQKNDKKKEVGDECDKLKQEILELAMQLPEEDWEGKTLRVGQDRLRTGVRKKVKFPDGDFDKQKFADEHGQYTTTALDEAKLLDQVKEGNEYLLMLGFEVKETQTVTLVKR